jgi:hypothetical protein
MVDKNVGTFGDMFLVLNGNKIITTSEEEQCISNEAAHENAQRH